MKRRDFLKGILSSVMIGTSVLKAKTKPEKIKPSENYTIYIGLLNKEKEISGKNYHRVKAGENWELKFDNNIYNTKEIIMPQAKSCWGNITGFAFFDMKKDGNILVSGKLTCKYFVNCDETVSFPPQYIKISL